MKTLFKSVLAIMLIAMLFWSCEASIKLGDDDDPDKKSSSSGIDYTNYPEAQAAIFVRNMTNEKLVAFKGSLEETYKLGGIPAGAQNHGLKNNTAIFTTTEDFPMVLITEAQYNANKSNLSALEYTPFTKVYVFFNKTSPNNVRYEISNKIGGDYQLKIVNTSKLNVELRVDGTAGPTLGYAPAGMQTTTLYLSQGDYEVFPVFKYYNKQQDIIETIFPTNQNNRAYYWPFAFDDDNKGPLQFDVKNALANMSERTSGAAYLVIVNNSAAGIRLYKGSTMMYTSTGTSFWNSGTNKVFQIDMPKVPGQQIQAAFEGTVQISNYVVGASADGVKIVDQTTGSDTLTLKVDYQYTVYVTGDINSSAGLKAVVVTEEGATNGPVKINFNNFGL